MDIEHLWVVLYSTHTTFKLFKKNFFVGTHTTFQFLEIVKIVSRVYTRHIYHTVLMREEGIEF